MGQQDEGKSSCQRRHIYNHAHPLTSPRVAGEPQTTGRAYSEADLALFAQYVERRAACRPKACTKGPRCWAALGPPGMNGGPRRCACVECGGIPGILPQASTAEGAFPVVADRLAAYPLRLIERCIEHGSPVVVRLLLDSGVVLAPGSAEPLDAFEAWLVERTLAAARSAAFRDTAEYEYLQAEWERGR